MRFTITEIATACGGEVHILDGAGSKEVSSVVLDSRIVTEGGVFIAQPGERVDGHSFIGQVFEKGVALVVTELTPEQVNEKYATPIDAWKSYIVVDNALEALKRIGKAYRETLNIPIVGITGSVGKTSTKEFIAGVLSEQYKVLKTEGNYNNEIGVPLTLLKIREEHEVAVVEMGISDFGEMTRLSMMVQPTVAVITNIGQCHLENLKTRDGILEAKTEIFKYMRKGATVCLYGGDDKLVTIDEAGGSKPLFFGIENELAKDAQGNVKELTVAISDIKDNGLLGSAAKLVVNPRLSGGESSMGDSAQTEGDIRDEGLFKSLVNVPLPGYHMVINAAAAATVALSLGLSPEQIVAGIENMKPISGRNNIIAVGDITLIDDCYNANPVSMKSSIDLLQLSKGETVAILGDMFELGENEHELHAQVGRYAVSANVNRLYCVGNLSKYMYDAAQELFADSGKNIEYTQVSYWAEKKDLLDGIREDVLSGRREMIPHGASILVKASHGMHFEEVVSLLKEIL